MLHVVVPPVHVHLSVHVSDPQCPAQCHTEIGLGGRRVVPVIVSETSSDDCDCGSGVDDGDDADSADDSDGADVSFACRWLRGVKISAKRPMSWEGV